MQLFFLIILVSFSHELRRDATDSHPVIGPLYFHVSAVFQMCSLEDS